jgi:hypothetical protein
VLPALQRPISRRPPRVAVWVVPALIQIVSPAVILPLDWVTEPQAVRSQPLSSALRVPGTVHHGLVRLVPGLASLQLEPAMPEKSTK